VVIIDAAVVLTWRLVWGSGKQGKKLGAFLVKLIRMYLEYFRDTDQLCTFRSSTYLAGRWERTGLYNTEAIANTFALYSSVVS
jgi:hypothetical protein